MVMRTIVKPLEGGSSWVQAKAIGRVLTDDVDVDLNFVADEGCQGLMLPGNSVISPVNFCRSVKPKDQFLCGWVFELACERDWKVDLFRDSLHGEGAVRDEVSTVSFLDSVADEGNGGILVHVEESGAAQVLIAFGDSGVDAGDANGCVHRGFGDVGLVVDDGQIKVCEFASYSRETAENRNRETDS